MRQEMRRAIGNLEWALEHLARVIITYKDEHPEIAAPLVDAAQTLEIVISTVQAVEENV
jgi:hypothetical protein